MKNILMIAPASIPVFGAEAIVNIRLIQALTNCQKFSIDLVSRKVKYSVYPYDCMEVSNLAIREHRIVETDNRLNISTIWQHLQCVKNFGCIFKGAHWASVALKDVIELVNKHKYDYVLTKNEPSFLIGAYLKKHYGIKWISTWNDPFPACKYPIPYGKGPNGKSFMSNKILKLWKNFADIHIFPCERIRDYVISYTGIRREKTRIIPHVIINQSITSHPEPTGKEIKLVSLGNVRKPRQCDNLIYAINRIRILNPDIQIRIDFIGLVDNYIYDLVNDYKLNDIVRIIPPVTYEESLNLLSKYDIAIIIEAPCEEGIFLPTKVSDYMSRNIPILSLSPKIGSLSDLYQLKYIPYFADITSVDEIVKTLINIYYDFPKLKHNKINKFYLEENVANIYYDF